MTLRDEVQKILDKSYSEYTYEDIDSLSKLKQKVGSKVAQAKRRKLEGEQLTANEKAKTYLILRAEGKTIEDAKNETKASLHGREMQDIALDAEYEELKNYYNDLNDCLISVRQNVKAFDYENNKSLSNNS